MNNTDYYDRLGVSKDASADEIKRAYRKMSKKYHPDINKEAGAEETYKGIQEAYETLSDDQKRAAYDQYGPDGANANFGGGFGSGYGDFSGSGFGGFEDIFSSFFGGGRRNPNAPMQGDDLQYRMDISFEDAIFGVEREITYTRESECATCHGSGAKPGTSPKTCSKCHGTGQMTTMMRTPFGNIQQQTTCDVCQGRGQEITEKCGDCHGSGHLNTSHTVTVKIPAGIETGQQIRLTGQGEAGINGGPYGDLYVRVTVEASDQFDRDGSTIYYHLTLNIVQAALGDTVHVPTVHGDVDLVIPEGTQTGKKIRLKGKGAPDLRGNGMGDQYVTIYVETPTNLTHKQKEALENFAKAGDISVSPHKKSFFDKVKDVFEG